MEMCRITLVVLCTKYTHGFILITLLFHLKKYLKNTNLGYTGGLKDDVYNKNVPDISVATTDLLQGK